VVDVVEEVTVVDADEGLEEDEVETVVDAVVAAAVEVQEVHEVDRKLSL
jgi:hypothetical protein